MTFLMDISDKTESKVLINQLRSTASDLFIYKPDIIRTILISGVKFIC